MKKKYFNFIYEEFTDIKNVLMYINIYMYIYVGHDTGCKLNSKPFFMTFKRLNNNRNINIFLYYNT